MMVTKKDNYELEELVSRLETGIQRARFLIEGGYAVRFMVHGLHSVRDLLESYLSASETIMRSEVISANFDKLVELSSYRVIKKEEGGVQE